MRYKELIKVIDQVIEIHDIKNLDSLRDLNETLTTLTRALYQLGNELVPYKEEWTKAFNSSSEKSDTKKEMIADELVPEYFEITQTIKGAVRVVDCLRSNISSNKNGYT